jgi:hypothetical protein
MSKKTASGTVPSATGIISSKVNLDSSENIIWISTANIIANSATVKIGGSVIDAKVINGGKDFIVLDLEKNISPGIAVIEVTYDTEFYQTSNKFDEISEIVKSPKRLNYPSKSEMRYELMKLSKEGRLSDFDSGVKSAIEWILGDRKSIGDGISK